MVIYGGKMKYTTDQLKTQVFLLVRKSLTEGLTREEVREYNRLVRKIDKTKKEKDDQKGWLPT